MKGILEVYDVRGHSLEEEHVHEQVWEIAFRTMVTRELMEGSALWK
jgi:hypothetical protein